MDVLEWTRKACKQLEQELDRTTAARDTLKAELTEVLGELAAANAHRNLLFKARDDANRELTRALAELRARDEAIADFDERARWRLAQLPYTGTGEP
jgi:chromosome segregation ATPase